MNKFSTVQNVYHVDTLLGNKKGNPSRRFWGICWYTLFRNQSVSGTTFKNRFSRWQKLLLIPWSCSFWCSVFHFQLFHFITVAKYGSISVGKKWIFVWVRAWKSVWRTL